MRCIEEEEPMPASQMTNGGWLAPHRLVESLPIESVTGKPALPMLADLLGVEDILLDLDATDKHQLFEAVGQHMEREHALPQAWVTESLSRREEAGSTGLGRGVAIPHARIRNLERTQVAYVRLKEGIPFDAPDGKPASDILVLLVPKQATEEHLEILAEAAQLFSDRNFREHLHACQNAVAIKRLFDSRTVGLEIHAAVFSKAIK
jgi:PTS system nitrogen regulatory IIA component